MFKLGLILGVPSWRGDRTCLQNQLAVTTSQKIGGQTNTLNISHKKNKRERNQTPTKNSLKVLNMFKPTIPQILAIFVQALTPMWRSRCVAGHVKWRLGCPQSVETWNFSEKTGEENQKPCFFFQVFDGFGMVFVHKKEFWNKITGLLRIFFFFQTGWIHFWTVSPHRCPVMLTLSRFLNGS